MSEQLLSGDGRMVLFPDDPLAAPTDVDAFVAALTTRGLLGERWRDNRFLVGRRFMQEIVFVGCSPFLRVDPRDDLRFCHLQLEIMEQPRFLRSADAGRPRCPECGGEMDESDPEAYRCHGCGRELAAWQCRWRPGRALHARSLLSIWTLQRGDARPTEALLAFLGEQLGGAPWKTAFLTP